MCDPEVTVCIACGLSSKRSCYTCMNTCHRAFTSWFPMLYNWSLWFNYRTCKMPRTICSVLSKNDSVIFLRYRNQVPVPFIVLWVSLIKLRKQKVSILEYDFPGQTSIWHFLAKCMVLPSWNNPSLQHLKEDPKKSTAKKTIPTLAFTLSPLI